MRSEQRVGKAGEQLAEAVLLRVGIKQLERIGTPVKRLKDRIIYGEKVAADYRGVFPVEMEREYDGVVITIGQSVMAEVKTTDHNLRWSDFREHQPGKLTEHSDLGGMSLVVWVHQSGVYVMRWPIKGFGPKRGLTPEVAEQIKMN